MRAGALLDARPRPRPRRGGGPSRWPRPRPSSRPALLLGPNVLPWYALWLLPLLVLRDEPAALLFTGTVSLAYLVYPDWQSGEPWRLGWGWRALEYGPCAAVALRTWTGPRRGGGIEGASPAG